MDCRLAYSKIWAAPLPEPDHITPTLFEQFGRDSKVAYFRPCPVPDRFDIFQNQHIGGDNIEHRIIQARP